MTNSAGQPGPAPAAGRGRLAQVIATRGGRAAPEAPFVIEHREALIYMLCEAAELEHGIMCQYLFAAFSMKQSEDEGLTPAELAAVTRWRKQISHVATQEMLHLALVQNLLSAIGAAPHMTRPNLPQPAGHYPAGVQLALLPFGEKALRHFMFLERPEGMDLNDADGLAAVGRAIPHKNERDIVPTGQDFATVGHLYRSIEAGFAHLADKYGERWLFVGPPRAQATEQYLRWPELVPVTGLASAQRAIDTILEQGEGPRGHWRNAHFGQFVEILDEFERMSADNPAFTPTRPVIPVNVRPGLPPIEMPLITDQLTARVTDLFNVGNEILLQMFERFFAHTEETDAQLKVLADGTIRLMFGVIKPLGDLITTLPAGPGYDGQTAGPSFELFYEDDDLMPHREAAWTLLAERLDETAVLCREIQAGPGARIAGQLAPVADALTGIAATLAAHLPADHPQAQKAAAASQPVKPEELDAALARARELAGTVADAPGDPAGAVGGELAALFQTAYSAVTAAAPRPPRADFVPRIVDSVLRPLSDAIRRLPNGAEPAAGAPPVPAAGKRGAGAEPGSEDAVERRGQSLAEPTFGESRQPAAQAAAPGAGTASIGDTLWQAAQSATRLRTSLGLAGDCPPGLAEATAALQALACDLVDPPEAAQRRHRLRELQDGLSATVQAARNGPYLATNVPRVLSHLGEQLPVPPQLALCRCGGSARKPFCDGSCASNGFSDAKDPNRVPDRRDTYPGQQVTIFDNRGLCQHSGFCTDRLPTVFRAGQEPFVAPSGGRMDEIIRAVRDCPSGALSFGVDRIEARSEADWDNTREPAVEITKDGPYRITGGIDLTDADGKPMPRNAGASLEHYAICRCGHSQNKPYCSGMHWYVGFRDPQPSAEPTLFEWAGGLPALTRMTRLLYEKHVPADPLLAAAFADMPPGYPQREAQRMGEIFDGPARDGHDGDSQDRDSQDRDAQGGDARDRDSQDRDAQGGDARDRDSQDRDSQGGDARGGDDGRAFTARLTEEQRARWVALAGQAATEAGLPADPPFRSALASYLEWDSRQAQARPTGSPAEQAAGGEQQPASRPVPRWDWTAAGPPDVAAASAVASQDSQPAEVPLPGPDEAVSFATHIRPLFRERDRQSMSFAFDLWSVDDVRAHAAGILGRLRDGSMPCDGAWPEDRVAVFQRWTESGQQD
jgi:CDGSH-type Zn-finger protein/truncated hemoglobin YjbI